MHHQPHVARAALAVASLAALLVAAPAGAAPTLNADLPCYSPGQPISLTGAGYTPGGPVTLSFALSGDHGNNVVAAKDALTADAAGGIGAQAPAPDLASDVDLSENVTLSANDQTRLGAVPPVPDVLATTQFQLTNVVALVVPWVMNRVNPRARTTFRIFGWEPYRRVYVHYFLRGKRLKTVSLGSVSGPCGDLTTTLRQFPFRPVPAGRYTIRFTGTRTYDPDGFWMGYRSVVVPRSKAVR